MKKLLYTFIAISFATTILAQDAPASKSVRFGVIGRATPTWYNMPTNNNYFKGGAILGTGFGLNLEFRLTDVVSFQTGIGGDFDGGKIKYAYNIDNAHPSNDIYTGYILDKTPALVNISGHSHDDFNSNLYSIPPTNTEHFLKSRQIHTTYVTIPLILKMKTKEIGGFKYFVDFGGNIGVLASAKATDNTEDLNIYTGAIVDGSYKNLNIRKDCNFIRAGLNVGAGAEYRLAGTTSIFFSLNFVNSFIPTVKSTSVYNTTAVDYTHNSQGSFTYAAQKLNTAGIQINVGFLF